jgi:hypothetical protein
VRSVALSPGRGTTPSSNIGQHHPQPRGHSFQPPAIWDSEYPRTVPLIFLQRQGMLGSGASSPSASHKAAGRFSSPLGHSVDAQYSVPSPAGGDIVGGGGEGTRVSPDGSSTPTRRPITSPTMGPGSYAASPQYSPPTLNGSSNRHHPNTQPPHLQGSLTTISSPYLDRVMSASAQKKLASTSK